MSQANQGAGSAEAQEQGPGVGDQAANEGAGALTETVAEVVNRLHREAHQNASEAVQLACELGDHLLAKKADLKHGEWVVWVGNNCEFSYPSAKVYMRAASQKARGLAFSSLGQLYGPKSVDNTQEVDQDKANRDVNAPPTQDQADVTAINMGLEALQLPFPVPETFIHRHGTDFLTDKAKANLAWLTRLSDMIGQVADKP